MNKNLSSSFILLTSVFFPYLLLEAEPNFISLKKIKIEESNYKRIPRYETTEDAKVEGVNSIYYDGPLYHGKPTRVFAYYEIPALKKGEKAPAVVLVHGGQGTAFAKWVKLWNSRGYAAIAIDHGGCIPIKGSSTSGWTKITKDSGPDSCSASFQQIAEPIEDQWPYYAVNAITLARNLIASFEEVEQTKIGITGISWGAVLTCITAGLDSRYIFAVPVYGCGNLLRNSAFSAELAKPEMKNWSPQFDPIEYISDAKMPFLWVTGTNDRFFPLDSLQKTYSLLKSPLTLCVKLKLEHSQEIGQSQEEIFAFADSICKGDSHLIKITAQGMEENSKAWIKWELPATIKKVELVFTKSRGEWKDKIWEAIPVANINFESGRAVSPLPQETTAFFFNITDEKGLVVSSKHFEL